MRSFSVQPFAMAAEHKAVRFPSCKISKKGYNKSNPYRKKGRET